MIDIKELSKITEFVKSLYPSYMGVDINVRGALGALEKLEMDMDEISIPFSPHLHNYILALMSEDVLKKEVGIMWGTNKFLSNDGTVKFQDVHGVTLIINWYKCGGEIGKPHPEDTRIVIAKFIKKSLEWEFRKNFNIEEDNNRTLIICDEVFMEIKNDDKFIYFKILKENQKIIKILENFYEEFKERMESIK